MTFVAAHCAGCDCAPEYELITQAQGALQRLLNSPTGDSPAEDPRYRSRPADHAADHANNHAE